MSNRYTPARLGIEIVAMLVALAWCIPFYYLLIVAVKPNTEVFTDPMGWPSEIVLGNFAEAWAGTMGVSIGQALLNSAIITLGSVFVLIAVGAVTAYVVARSRALVSLAMFSFFVVGLILPHQLAVVPLFAAMRSLGLVGNHLGMIVLYSGLMMPMAIFLYAGFVRTIPKDYEEAAEVDGAGRGRIFWKVVFPLLRPVTATVAIMTGMIIWNDFFNQVIFLSGSDVQTLPVAIYGFVGEFTARWNMVFAVVLVAIAPVLGFYLFAQKQLIEGFTGGIKG
ncbi:carbohydrate ABC transporter permease [Pelagibacterium halotolerans]|uniref:sn-glycerol-3-phosphate transport system permease protein UgpE n=1 Tax=Pelagibacterium halotolerans (strain DSM 22347 / JCM 15775 / CGMCC 1.7692 / B2) TaxID=1082931 RepID=G4R7F1_PELHB|nr:carbohydrate ABC transporter permease [Pelagibacterium halotolerans]AEQ51289.1 maltose transport protein AmyC [Pelagibacterium halotolerans B2]QJR18854.1 carbohydrate ABC transporter permease [Pelagibacterium halotolerans]SEA66361.1 carbohydrate ABC transporter membrane protein 2, CUT1 family [Pelagibacterium halotolerans]